MEKKFIMVSMEDERAGKIADVLGNKTCKKIVNFLAEEKEASENDIATRLNIPLNTAEYNLKKLLEAELIEKSKNFFWSKKGKRIPMYKVSNKSILISPKSRISSKLKSVVPALIIGGVGALLIKYLINPVSEIKLQASEALISKADEAVSLGAISNFVAYIQSLPNWYWFSLGVILTLIIIIVSNWRKL